MKPQTPLYQKLKHYADEHYTSYHMPVHSYRSPVCDAFGMETIALDTTELDATDNLVQPEGCIAQAHQAAAEAFGCDFAHFMVGGSTAGIHAMLLYACRRGDTVLIDRCAHASVLNACAMFGLKPVFIERELLPGCNIAAPLSAGKVRDSIQSHPTASAVLVTSPTYYGINSDLRAIADVVHNSSMLLLADAAHGSHYSFSPNFPESAIRSGADICTVSLHKTLGALTQTALLLANRNTGADERWKTAINMVQTTSPSYLLMCSAELCIADMCVRGRIILPELAKQVFSLAHSLQSRTLLRCLPASGVDCDPLRLTISCLNYDITGYELAQRLHAVYHIDVEMADPEHVVCIIGPYIQPGQLHVLEEAIVELVSHYPATERGPLPLGLPLAKFGRMPTEAFAAESELVPLEECCGRICAANLCVYPPGIVVVACGCEMTPEACDYLTLHIRRGGQVTGLRNSLVPVVK